MTPSFRREINKSLHSTLFIYLLIFVFEANVDPAEQFKVKREEIINLCGLWFQSCEEIPL